MGIFLDVMFEVRNGACAKRESWTEIDPTMVLMYSRGWHIYTQDADGNWTWTQFYMNNDNLTATDWELVDCPDPRPDQIVS